MRPERGEIPSVSIRSVPTRRAWILMTLALCFSVGFGSFEATAGPAESFDPSEVRPGLTGRAYTVFEGNEPRPFDVELLGVLQGSQPKGSRILFRALGDSLERTGIVSGMSGSPVYVEGKLLGAIAFSFAFSKEPIGLITPIGEMREGIARTGQDPAPWMGPRPTAAEDWLDAFLAGDPAPELWAELVPAYAPPKDHQGLVAWFASGWDPKMRASFPSFADRAGLALPAAGAAAGGAGSGAQVRPGSALGVRLIEGDASLAAIGTVTEIDGDRVAAFGHPLFQAGPVALPMTTAWIHAVVPSLASPFKMGSAGETIGTVRQDLRGGIAGILGEGPELLPVRVVLEGPEGTRRYAYRVARGTLLEPSLLTWATANSFLQYGWAVGNATVDLELNVFFNDGRSLTRRETVGTGSPVVTMSQLLLLPVPMLLGNRHEPVSLDSVTVRAAYAPELRENRLVSLRAKSDRLHPGETLRIEARLEGRDGVARDHVVALPVPQRWAGRELLVIAGGSEELTAWDRERAPTVYQPRDLDGLIRLIEELPGAGELIVRVYGEGPGVILGGREVGSLPRSVADVLGARHKQGPAHGATRPLLVERRIGTGGSVRGGAAIRIEVE
ncbi:MAG: hypothetical protein GF346_10980 [Candidatus Eisenbacteria bacterium]|nr:hypothetical protein [Candidatus Latescibacterota bacterium]MBD3302961.1 hypothetical protein [Candidatus Eisenbacteria bacterium]